MAAESPNAYLGPFPYLPRHACDQAGPTTDPGFTRDLLNTPPQALATHAEAQQLADSPTRTLSPKAVEVALELLGQHGATDAETEAALAWLRQEGPSPLEAMERMLYDRLAREEQARMSQPPRPLLARLGWTVFGQGRKA